MKTLIKIKHRITAELLKIQAMLSNRSGNESLEKIAWALATVVIVGIVYALFKANINTIFNSVLSKIQAALNFE